MLSLPMEKPRLRVDRTRMRRLPGHRWESVEKLGTVYHQRGSGLLVLHFPPGSGLQRRLRSLERKCCVESVHLESEMASRGR
jgi:hypothetical protein